MNKETLLEKLSRLEHEQWAHWTEYMLNNLNRENISQWRRQIITKYDNLSDREKESDRSWARKVMKIMEGNDE